MPRSPTLPELKFVVVGAKSAGKSTFIRCALDLKRPPSSQVASKKMSLEGEVFSISLVELPLQDVDIADNAILWPHRVLEAGVSHVDGVLALYDVTERDTLSGIPNLLNACSKTSTPCVLVSCKCDITVTSSKSIDPRDVEKSCMRETGIESCQTMQNKPETHKRCISVILRNLMSNPTAAGQLGRPRAWTASQLSMSNKSAVSTNLKYGHSRAASEMTNTSRGNGQETHKIDSIDAAERPRTQERQTNSGDRKTLDVAHAPSKDDGPQQLKLDLGGTLFMEPNKTNLAVGTPTTIANSFLDIGGEGQDESIVGEEKPLAHNAEENDPDSDSTGYSFDDLVQRLLAQPMSKADSRFVSVFLCLYRKFAAPAQLLAALMSRFEGLSHNGEQQILKIGAQLRYLSILAQWTSEYPGDFAHPITWSQMGTFVTQLSGNQLFAAAASEMRTQLDAVHDDDDTQWLCSDVEKGARGTLKCFAVVPSLRSLVLETSSQDGGGSQDDQASALTSTLSLLQLQLQQQQQRQAGHTQASSSVSSMGRPDHLSSVSSSKVLGPTESSQRQAELLAPVSRNVLSKPQWHQFMDLAEDDIAKELTRIDWIMYSAMKPRDLIRHVSLTPAQKEKCQSLQHVNRMINQFNHVAFWVANMVLLRDKAKHRAKALEKFMGVAWKLRQLNNYNSLGAVIAGINGTAVHRLVQTRELVPAQARRDFMRLEILMGTQRSHFAYRLAWENTLGEKIPFLPLHRRDLVSAEEGNRTLIQGNPGRINWKKFDVMGDTVIGIQKSQGTPYSPIQRNIEIQRLILDARFSKDDDELYERSMQVEGPIGNEPRRRFNWFQR